ncbi:hypothetical protein LshimejAT787_1402910 [Lyophyllum shimeji]|uniref:Uncharacterized protein n=1 Tax=Lyophyllum shimeji TaxID=47721 RepID=A0A9P3UQC8_LYOSH|nr:hypothetical protein LshimejAT787_1402910 [Lyophyllum shimeji]
MSVHPVVIDDTDPAIRYTGTSWTSEATGSQDEFGTHGKTYNHTLHATNANDTFAFSFQGSSIRVFGTVNLAPTYGYSVVSGPDFRSPWECFVDNVSIGAVKPSLFHENNQLLCDGAQLPDGSHELTVQIKMRNGTTFWLDYLQYTPIKAPSDDSVFLVENTDPGISAVLTVTRAGTQLTWVGYVPIALPGNATSASYSIDNGPSKSFALTGHAPFDGTSLFNQVLFTTPELSESPHTISVTYDGDEQHTPLTLDYIYLTVPSGASTAGQTVVSGAPHSGSHTPVGAIVGGTLGGIVGVAIALILVLFIRRRRSVDRSRRTTAIPFSPTRQPSSTDIDNAGSGWFVSGAMAQVQDRKVLLASDRTHAPSNSGPHENDLHRNGTVPTDGPPRYSAV